MNLQELTQTKSLYINGEWKKTNETFEIKNPATGEIIETFSFGGKEETLEAIDAAHDSFSSWSKTSPKERADLLLNLYELMLKNKEKLASSITKEMGKPITQARLEVINSADYIRWNAEEARRIYGKEIQPSDKSKRLQILREPVGPVAAITPWNFPLGMLARKVGPALAAGCTIVIKPAKQTSLSAVEFMKLVNEVGFPSGVVNLVMGQTSIIGDTLLTDKRIRKITFTGSTEVGKMLYEKAAKQVKRVSMELGGNAPLIIFEDCHLESTVNQVVRSKFNNTGQTCICPNRIYVQSSIREEFLTLFTQKVLELKVGNGIEDDIEVGPIIDEKSLAKIEGHVKDAIDKGAKLIAGGERINTSNMAKGCFYLPTILDEVNEDMLISNDETFGPVAPIFSFDTEEEVIEKANNTEFGLAAYIFTENLSRSIRVSRNLEYGMVGINDTVLSQVEGAFGGVKESGIGREGGPDSLEDFLETKFISIKSQ